MCTGNAVAGTCTSSTGTVYTLGTSCSGAGMMISSCQPGDVGCTVNQCKPGAVCTCDAVCPCSAGQYSGLSSEGGLKCLSCPSGGTSSTSNNKSISDCYKTTGIYDASIHGSKAQTCYANASGSYTLNCKITGMYACDAGYYRANTTDMFCTPVGNNYYSSSSSLTRTLCESYTNPSGGTSYGQTAGGTEADAKTDCRIPMSEVFSDTEGSWVYDPYCKYTTGIVGPCNPILDPDCEPILIDPIEPILP